MQPRLAIPVLEASLPAWQVVIGATTAICFLVAGPLAEKLENIPRRVTVRVLLGVGVATFVTARLHFVVTYWSTLFQRSPLDALRIWSGGLLAPGAIAGLAISIVLACKFYGLRPGAFADALTPVVGLGIAIARIGCLLEGCCLGGVCSLPWCVSFPATSAVYALQRFSGSIPEDAMRSLPVHPLPLYFSVTALVIGAIGLFGYRWRRFPGEIALASLFAFSVCSAGLEAWFVEDAPTGFLGAKRLTNAYLMAAMLAGLPWLLGGMAKSSPVHRGESGRRAPGH